MGILRLYSNSILTYREDLNIFVQNKLKPNVPAYNCRSFFFYIYNDTGRPQSYLFRREDPGTP